MNRLLTLLPTFLLCTLTLSAQNFCLQAHRGLSNRYPENSVPAFVQAGKAGVYYGMETDVQMTSDGVLVCMHDATLDRTTDHSGAVSDYTFAQLKKIRLDGGYGWSEAYAGKLKIPTFKEYLKICRRSSLVPYVELKLLTPEGVRKTVEMLHDMGFEGKYVLTSFHKDYLEVAARYTDAPLEYMHRQYTPEIVDSCVGPLNFVIRPSARRMTEELVRHAVSRGFTVECYGIPVGDADLVARLMEWGVKGGTCNDYIDIIVK